MRIFLATLLSFGSAVAYGQFVDITAALNYQVVNSANKPLPGLASTITTETDTVSGPTTNSSGSILIPPMNVPFYLGLVANNVVQTYFWEPTWNPRKLVVTENSAADYVQVSGTAEGFNTKNYDGEVDFAIIVSPFRKADLLTFDLRKLLSDETDTIPIYTSKFDVPSNLSLPKQTELYVLPVKLNKPGFRLNPPKEPTTSLYALRGHFNLKQVIAGSGGSSDETYKLLNYLKLKGGGLASFTPEQLTKPLVMPVNQIDFTLVKSVPLPTLNADEVLFLLGLSKKEEFYLPSDMKLVGTGTQANVNFIPESSPYVAYVVKRNSEFASSRATGLDRLSLQLSQVGSTTPVTPIPLIDDPVLSGDRNTITTQIPTSPPSLKSRRQLIMISSITEVEKNGRTVKKYDKVMQLWFQDWKSEVQLPRPLDEVCIRCRIDVTLMGTNEATATTDELEWVGKATHVSHVSIEP